MKAFFARNLIAAFALFALAVLMDYAHIKVASPAAENFVVVPLAFLAIVAPPVEGEVGRLMLASLDSTEAAVLIEESTNAQYVEPGYILFGRKNDLYAWRFDLSELKLIGQPAPVQNEKISLWESKNLLIYSASDDGTVVYLPEIVRKSSLKWVGRDGRFWVISVLPTAVFGSTGRRRGPGPILRTPFEESFPELSPDGRWLAYVSTESGRAEVYVRPASGSFEQWQLSNGGGAQPRWSRGGRELLYVALDGNVMSVSIRSDPVFRPGVPAALFKLPEPPDRHTPIFEDVTADGERILLNVPTTARSSVTFHVVLNWTSMLRDQVE